MRCARAVYMNEGPCKAARGVRVLGRPRTFRRPKNRPSPREPIGESNPTASSHTGDGAPARARMRAASVHTRCAWRPGGEDRATKKRAVRVYGTAPLTHDLQVRRKNGGKRRDARPPGLGGLAGQRVQAWVAGHNGEAPAPLQRAASCELRIGDAACAPECRALAAR